MYQFTENQLAAAREYVKAERANPYRNMSVAMIAAQKALRSLVPVTWDDDETSDSRIAIIRLVEKEMGPKDERTDAAKEIGAILCPRCLGSGNFSYNQRYGTVCFKCNGTGTVKAR